MFKSHANTAPHGDTMNEKIVQTELTGTEYKKLKDLSRSKKMSLKEALREAVREWVRQQTPLEKDPLFSLEPQKTGIKTDSSNLDKELYGKKP